MNGILCINKPANWTSFDVVNKLSKALKVKVGHTGTLDPQATGVLVCLINNTKVLPYLDMSTKRYQAKCQLGTKTDTKDAWGKILEVKKPKEIHTKRLETILNQFVGKQTQIIPMTSAKKYKGKKLYEYQRSKIEIETLSKEIEIFELKLLKVNKYSFEFEALVSSGTYIRTLCEDLARALDEIGTMSQLLRLTCGPFTLKDCVTIDEALEDPKLLPIEQGLQHLKRVNVDDPTPIYHGKTLELNYLGELIGVYYQDKICAIYEYDDHQKKYRSKRGLWL